MQVDVDEKRGVTTMYENEEEPTIKYTTSSVDEGLKYDTGKIRMDLLPVTSLREVAKVLTYGAAKYGDNNWRKGMAWSRLYGAALRHLTSHMEGDSIDVETGISHLAHATVNLMFLLQYEAKGLGTDDRPGE